MSKFHWPWPTSDLDLALALWPQNQHFLVDTWLDINQTTLGLPTDWQTNQHVQTTRNIYPYPLIQRGAYQDIISWLYRKLIDDFIRSNVNLTILQIVGFCCCWNFTGSVWMFKNCLHAFGFWVELTLILLPYQSLAVEFVSKWQQDGTTHMVVIYPLKRKL